MGANKELIDIQLIDRHAKRVCERMNKAGYTAYLVGGCLRDLIAGHVPKDFDVAADATADQTVKLFRGALRIGRRFPIVHVRAERNIIEVSTLKREKVSFWKKIFSRSQPDLLFEDAKRRDFTVNAIYYSLEERECLDPLNGIQDIEKKLIRSIGDANRRVQEDSIRMLRAVRLAAKLDFTIDSDLQEAIKEHKSLLLSGSEQRLFQEFVKVLLSGRAVGSWRLMQQTGIWDILCPALNDSAMTRYHAAGLELSDQRIQSGRKVSLIYALAMMYWPAFSKEVGRYPFKVKHEWMAILNRVLEPMHVPNKIKEGVHQLYEMQYRMQYSRADEIPQLMMSPRFKAAYDFFMMRAAADSSFYQIASWWSDFFKAEDWVRAYMINDKLKREKRRAEKPMRKRPGHRRRDRD